MSAHVQIATHSINQPSHHCTVFRFPQLSIFCVYIVTVIPETSPNSVCNSVCTCIIIIQFSHFSWTPYISKHCCFWATIILIVSNLTKTYNALHACVMTVYVKLILNVWPNHISNVHRDTFLPYMCAQGMGW